ncbi:MAG: cytochrome o ubiquinol oxidase [Vicingaceae bacterium]|nr:MAG: cytochrome o ubiquinol oxidase [Vicingaceae bacterium]
MDWLKRLFDFILHIDVHLLELIHQYGTWVYVILFLIIFVETGLVVMPFLPGDSLLFAAGAFAAQGSLNIFVLLILLFVAAVIGDSLNYYLGKTIGLKVLQWKVGGKNLVKKEYIDKTKEFYAKYGSKTIVIARFVPIVRTFAPFVAGVGDMQYRKFIFYNIAGGFIWVFLLTLAGYFFGNIPIVKNHFEKVIFLIIFISILPIITEWIKHLLKKRKKSTDSSVKV